MSPPPSGYASVSWNICHSWQPALVRCYHPLQAFSGFLRFSLCCPHFAPGWTVHRTGLSHSFPLFCPHFAPGWTVGCTALSHLFPLFCPLFAPGRTVHCTELSHSFPLVCDSFSVLFLVTATVLRSCGQVLGRRCFNLGYAGVFLTIRLGLWVLERAWHMAEGCPTVFSTPGDYSHCPHNILWLPGVKEGGEAPAPWSGHCIHILSETLCKEQWPLLTHFHTYSIMIFISMDFIYVYI